MFGVYVTFWGCIWFKRPHCWYKTLTQEDHNDSTIEDLLNKKNNFVVLDIVLIFTFIWVHQKLDGTLPTNL